MTQNWRPQTLENYVFIQEGLQKSLFPPISKSLTKCLPKCHQNGAKISKIQVWRPPRKHNKNKRKNQRKLDPKSSQRGEPRTWFSQCPTVDFRHPSAAECVLSKSEKSQQKNYFLKHAFRCRGVSKIAEPNHAQMCNFDPKVHLGGPGGPLGSKTTPQSS